MSTVDQIIQRWPLRSMCVRLNIEIPERGKFRSPFRPDNNPSCEVWKETIRDRSTGESYDSIRCFAEVKGLSNSDAIKALAAELPGRESRPKQTPTPKSELAIPLVKHSKEELIQLAELRGIGLAGTEVAAIFLGTLGFADVAGFPCWIVSDGSKRIAEARRMDGKPFPAIGSLAERKSHTLKGSCKAWPLGIMPPKVKGIPADAPVVLVEGMPDYISACDVLSKAERDFLPVAMLGASQSIHADALPFFKGRDVLILGHPDQAGLDAARKWSAQLREAGARPRARQLDGGDLNDLVTRHGAEAVAKGLEL